MNPPFPANQGGTHSPYVEKSRKCIRRADTRVRPYGKVAKWCKALNS